MVIALSTLYFVINLMPYIVKSPMPLAMVILALAITLTLIYSLLVSSWVALMIFIIYVGGMMVIFVYFTALTPMTKMGSWSTKYSPLRWALLTLFMIFLMPGNIDIPEHFISSSCLIYSSSSSLVLGLASLLLVIMVFAVKLVSSCKGPLRSSL